MEPVEPEALPGAFESLSTAFTILADRAKIVSLSWRDVSMDHFTAKQRDHLDVAAIVTNGLSQILAGFSSHLPIHDVQTSEPIPSTSADHTTVLRHYFGDMRRLSERLSRISDYGLFGMVRPSTEHIAKVLELKVKEEAIKTSDVEFPPWKVKMMESRLGLSDSSGLSEDKLQAERTRESNTLLWPQDVVPTVDDILSAETTIVKKDSRATLKRFGPSIIVKYGRFVHLAEVEALTFAASHTSIPVPSVLASYPAGDCHCIVMQNIPGVPLSQAWDSLSSGDRVVIQRELRGYIQDLRHVMAERWIGSVGKTPCRDLIFRCYLEGNKGPFSSEFDFNSAIVDTLDLLGDFPVDKQLLRQTFTRRQPHRIVFTHGDINPDNIMIHNGHVSGIIDWEQAGFYPEYWEYCKTLVSSRLNKDWSLDFVDAIMDPYPEEYLVHVYWSQNFRDIVC